jgi:hypothetical protein
MSELKVPLGGFRGEKAGKLEGGKNLKDRLELRS